MSPSPWRSPSWVGGVLLAAFVIARIAMIPADAAVLPGFLHDSGYIGIVARNLVEGRGYVNDAHWLLFLNPPQLPMPFHNANPGYPTLTAGVMAVTGWEAARAMIVVSVLGGALVAIGVRGIARHFLGDRRPWLPVLAGAIAVLLPANWRLSFVGLPDLLATGIVMCLFAVVLRATRTWHWLAAGALFGLAWLTRSSVTLILPGIAIWALARHGLTASVKRGLLAGAAAIVVVLPWLVHTARVRGSALSSDSSYYLLLRYHADKTGRSEDQFYRSLQRPPTASAVLRADPSGVARAVASGFPVVMYRVIAGLAEWEKTVAILLVAALVMGVSALPRQRWRPELAGGAMIWLTLLAALAIRGNSVEIRYFSAGTTLFALLLVAPLTTGVTRAWWRAAPLGAYLATGLIRQDVQMARAFERPSEPSVEMRSVMLQVASTLPDGDVAVSAVPYFFTYYTGRGAVSPAYPGKRELLRVMERYRASVVMLPTDSLDYYYPGSPSALSPDLTLDRAEGRFTILRRTPSTNP